MRQGGKQMGKETGRDACTRERLLNESEHLFALKGYDAVSIREITTEAECNLAAVNYHFGNKENLYVEVFRHRWAPRSKRLQEHFRRTLAAHGPISPSGVVRSLAEAFLMGPLSDEERCRHHQLMARELGQPTAAFELVAKEVMRPFFKELAAILRPFMPEELGEEGLMLNILSVFAMVLYFNFARAAVTRITGRQYDEPFKSRLVEHIIGFSLEGLGRSTQEASK